MKRKILITLGILIILLVALVLLYNQFAQREDDILRIGYNVESLNYAPFIVAYEKDFFNKHGVKIEAVPLKSSKEIKQALAVGQVDIGFGSPTNFFIPISKGVPIKIIAPMSSAPTYLFVRPDNEIKTFGDLLGKTIVTNPGGTSDYIVRYVLIKENIDVSKINFVDIDKTYKPIALMKKKVVDAVPVSEQEEAKYLELGAVIHEEWKTKGYVNQRTPRAVIAINKGFKLSHPLLVEQFIDAIIEGHKFIKSNPQEAAQIVSSHIEKGSGGAVIYSPEYIITIWENQKLEYDLWYDPAILQEISKIAVEIGDIESELSLDKMFDLSFEEKLKNAQNKLYESAN